MPGDKWRRFKIGKNDHNTPLWGGEGIPGDNDEINCATPSGLREATLKP
jgi:hypothetical protein